MDENLTKEQLQARLHATEEALQRSERLAVASRYAGAVMHEVNNPLEALTNLVYLTRKVKSDPQKIEEIMDIADKQLQTVANITRKTLSYYRDQAEAKDFDLVDIAESALRIHAARARKQQISVHMKSDGPAFASVFASDILQILSNFILNSFDALRIRAENYAFVSKLSQIASISPSLTMEEGLKKRSTTISSPPTTPRSPMGRALVSGSRRASRENMEAT